MGRVSQLTIRTVEDGGFCVSVPPGFGDCGHDVLATTTLDEALAYVRRRMAPEKTDGAADLTQAQLGRDPLVAASTGWRI